MSNTIKLKRGTSTPTTSNIASGEVAVDTSAQKLYINDSGTIKEIGGGGGVVSDAQSNTVAGTNAGDNFSGTSAEYNTLFGADAGKDITTADKCTAVGYKALAGANSTNVTGEKNVAVGYESLTRSTDGESNVGVGMRTLAYVTLQDNNTAVGHAAGFETTGSGNTYLGYTAGMSNTSSSNCTIIGNAATSSSNTVSNEITLGNTAVTKFRVPGINFTVKDTTATEDYVLTVDANGEAGWEAAAGGTDSTKMPLAGGTFTGDTLYNDNVKAKFGTGTDLEIFHNGTDSWVKNVTGKLRLCNTNGNGNEVKIGAREDQDSIIVKPLGATEIYHNGAKKFETLSSGIRFNDWNLELKAPDNNEARLAIIGDNGDDNNDWSRITSYDGVYKWQNMASGGWETNIECNGNGNVELNYDNSKKFETTSAGAKLSGNLAINNSTQSKIVLDTSDGSDSKWLNINGGGDASQSRGGGIMLGGNEYSSNEGKVWLLAGNSGSANGTIDFSTGGNLRARLTHDGHFTLPTDSSILKLGASNDLQIYHDGTDSTILNNTGILELRCNDIRLMNNAGNEHYVVGFANSYSALYYDNSKKFETKSSGSQFYGHLITGDNNEIQMGDSGDLHIYHDGSNSRVRETGTGNLRLEGTAVELWNDGSKVCNTFANGIQVTGISSTGTVDIPSDSAKLRLGASQDLQIYHDGSHSFLVHDGTGNLNIEGNYLKLRSVNNQNYLYGQVDNAVTLYYDDSPKFATTSTGATVTGGLLATDTNPSIAEFYHSDGGTGDEARISLGAYSSNPPAQRGITLVGKNNGAGHDFLVNTSNSHSAGPTEKLRVTSGGNLKLPDSAKIELGGAQTGSGDLQIYHDGSNSHIANSTGYLFLNSTASYATVRSASHIYLQPASGEAGAYVLQNAGVELYYDNAKKFETRSDGTQTTGICYADRFHVNDSELISLGDSSDLTITHDGTHNVISCNTDKNLRIVNHLTGGNESMIVCDPNGVVELYYNGLKKLQTDDNGIEIHDLDDTTAQAKFISSGGTLGSVYGNSNDSTFGLLNTAGEWIVQGVNNGATNLYYDHSKKFETFSGGFRLVNNGAFTMNSDSSSIYFGASDDMRIMWDGSRGWINNQTTGHFQIRHGGSTFAEFQSGGDFWNKGHIVPWSNNTYDLGLSSYRWRNIYTNDLNLSNEGGDGNSVDGTTGSWTIQEGADDLFIVNNKNGKKFKIALQEVS